MWTMHPILPVVCVVAKYTNICQKNTAVILPQFDLLKEKYNKIKGRAETGYNSSNTAF